MWVIRYEKKSSTNLVPRTSSPLPARPPGTRLKQYASNCLNKTHLNVSSSSPISQANSKFCYLIAPLSLPSGEFVKSFNNSDVKVTGDLFLPWLSLTNGMTLVELIFWHLFVRTAVKLFTGSLNLGLSIPESLSLVSFIGIPLTQLFCKKFDILVSGKFLNSFRRLFCNDVNFSDRFVSRDITVFSFPSLLFNATSFDLAWPPLTLCLNFGINKFADFLVFWVPLLSLLSKDSAMAESRPLCDLENSEMAKKFIKREKC